MPGFHASTVTNCKFPEWLISPDCHQKMGGGAAAPPPTPHPLPHGTAYAWASFNFELWEGHSVSEVFAGVHGAGPPGRGCKETAPPCLRKFCIWWAHDIS